MFVPDIFFFFVLTDEERGLFWQVLLRLLVWEDGHLHQLHQLHVGWLVYMNDWLNRLDGVKCLCGTMLLEDVELFALVAFDHDGLLALQDLIEVANLDLF